MSSDRPRADEVFAAALEIADPTVRSTYLDRACAGDVALRREVESLLSAHARGGNFLETGVMAEALPALPPTEQPGQRIGRYRLLEQIGEGGFALQRHFWPKRNRGGWRGGQKETGWIGRAERLFRANPRVPRSARVG